jgi:hypothetical protein
MLFSIATETEQQQITKSVQTERKEEVYPDNYTKANIRRHSYDKGQNGLYSSISIGW